MLCDSNDPSPWKEVKQFRRDDCDDMGVLDEEAGDRQAEPPPDIEWLTKYWQQHAINAVSVHISGKSSCLVAVPLATQQLSASMATGTEPPNA